jgi:hypothetical protein
MDGFSSIRWRVPKLRLVNPVDQSIEVAAIVKKQEKDLPYICTDVPVLHRTVPTYRLPAVYVYL